LANLLGIHRLSSGFVSFLQCAAQHLFQALALAVLKNTVFTEQHLNVDLGEELSCRKVGCSACWKLVMLE